MFLCILVIFKIENWFMHKKNTWVDIANHLISIWGNSCTLGGLWLPKGSFGDLWPPINYLFLRKKGTQFGLKYPPVRLCVAEYRCPYYSVVVSIYYPAHCSMTQIICLPTLLHLCRNKSKNPCPGSQFNINVDHE